MSGSGPSGTGLWTVGLGIYLGAVGLGSGCAPAGDRSPAPPNGAHGDPPASELHDGAGSPALAYVLVGPRGAEALDRLPAAATLDAAARPTGLPRLRPGFGFVVTEERAVGARRFVHLAEGRWLPAESIARVRPSTFVGIELAGRAPLDVAWVVSAVANRETPALPLHTAVHLTGPCLPALCPTDAGVIPRSALAIPSLARPPAELGSTRDPDAERWLDIDLASQTLVAYRGRRPVFATLISSGVGRPGSVFDTPVGTFRITSKHPLARMDNLEHAGVAPYAYDVPFTQYFRGNKALHAAPWHDRFGHPTSHGCVNLSPGDAAYLFDLTSPSVPAGAARVDATPANPGSWVRIRSRLARDPKAGPR